MADSQFPGIKDMLWVRLEILHVAGDHGEAVALGGGHEQAVHHRHGLSGQFGIRGHVRLVESMERTPPVPIDMRPRESR